MRRSLELTTEAAKKNYSGGKEVDFVLAATGPRVWSDAVAEEIGIPTGLGAQAIQEQVWGDQKTYKRARELGLCLMSMSFVGGKGAIPENMEHQYASQFYDRDYHSWIANVTEHLNQTQGSTD